MLSKRLKKDEWGNYVCDKCMAHIPPKILSKHVCPPFLVRLASSIKQ